MSGPDTVDYNITLFGERLGYQVQQCLDLRTRVEHKQHALERLQDGESALRTEVNTSHTRVAEEAERLEHTRLAHAEQQKEADTLRAHIADATEEHTELEVQRDAALAQKVSGTQQITALHAQLADQANVLDDTQAELREADSNTKRERAALEQQRLATEQTIRKLDMFESNEARRNHELRAAIQLEQAEGHAIKARLNRIAELLCGKQKKSKKKLRESLAGAGIDLDDIGHSATTGISLSEDEEGYSTIQSILGTEHNERGASKAAAAAMGGAENAPNPHLTPTGKPTKEPKIKVLDHVRESFESPGGNFNYNWSANKQVSTPKVRHTIAPAQPFHMCIADNLLLLPRTLLHCTTRCQVAFTG
jgi:hypothetical protein